MKRAAIGILAMMAMTNAATAMVSDGVYGPASSVDDAPMSPVTAAALGTTDKQSSHAMLESMEVSPVPGVYIAH